MGFRFSRRISIMPGVRINLSKSGASLSAGPRGASVTVGRRGIFGNVGLPGTGLSYRTRLDTPSNSSSRASHRPDLPGGVHAEVMDDEIVFCDAGGSLIDPSLVPEAKRQLKEDVRELLEQTVEVRNYAFQAITTLHHDVPRTVAKKPAGAGKPVEQDYPDREAFMMALMSWRASSANAASSAEEIETAVLECLGALEWPFETNISVELRGTRLLLDVDLPEIEHMPSEKWVASHTKLSLSWKRLSLKDVAAIYVSHVCSLIVRLVGHALAAHPEISSVAISGYTQRNTSLGRVSDEYVAAVEATRTMWNSVDLASIRDVDPENLLRRFDAKIETSSRGLLKLQSPLL